MWVVKIGGSLQNSDCLTGWLEGVLRYGSGKVVIVPGGGKFADAVRQSQSKLGFDDASAHKMALLAMEQTAHLFSGLAPELRLVSDITSIHHCLADKGVAVWLPYKEVARQPQIPASWDVTADGLAAWLAIQLRFSSLLLVKSIPLPTGNPTFDKLVELGLIDPFIARLSHVSDLKISWMGKEECNLLPALLRKKPRYQDRRIVPHSANSI